MSALLSVEDLSYAYKHLPVLHRVTFQVRAGEIAVVLGPNGAGKSTLLKCVAYMLRPREGRVSVAGEDVRTWSARQRARVFAYVPQINTGNMLTVFDTVLLGRKPHMRWSPTGRDVRVVEELLELLGLDALALRPTNTLSGGELQKVVLARALAQEPRILLLDEFTNNLDIRNRIEAMQWVQHVVRARNIAAVVVTHEFNLALRYGDRYIVIDKGRVRAAGDRSVITPQLLEDVFGIRVRVEYISGHPLIVPLL